MDVPPCSISVLIADDHTLFRKCLATILNQSEKVSIIGEAGNGLEALALADELRPDILLLDLSMPAMDGYAVLKKLQETGSPVKTIIISMFFEGKIITKAVELGAAGFLTKNAEPEDIIEAIENVYIGNTWYCKNTVFDPATVKKPALMAEKSFSAREMEVLQLLGEGLVSKEIAERLCLSTRTVEDVRQHLMNKTQSHTVTALIAYAYKNGLVAN